MLTSPSIRCDMDFAFKILSNCGSAASSYEIRGPKRRICGQFFNTKSFRLQSYDRQTHGKAINSFRKKFVLFSLHQQKRCILVEQKIVFIIFSQKNLYCTDILVNYIMYADQPSFPICVCTLKHLFPHSLCPLGIYVDAAICPQKEYQRTNALDFGLKSSVFSDVDVVLLYSFLGRSKL